MPKVIEIPAIQKETIKEAKASRTKRRVAGYARVSTDHDEQINSYEAQIDYYTNYIRSNSRWEFVDVYTDEGITGTSTRHRDGFNRMIADALAGKIDLIVTKSVSRFARNTVDSLTVIRKLKENGIEVYFEKEAIWTFDSKGELLITIMSSLAQEESRSISENVTWGQRKRFADGKVRFAYKNFLGLDRANDGRIAINSDQARIVRQIYYLFLMGYTPCGIAKKLTEEGIPTPSGKSVWRAEVILSILSNEKYQGNALLQKKFTVDFLNRKMKINEGEVPQYYVVDSHEAIVAPEEFELVQAEILRRQGHKTKYSGKQIFCSKVICSECGGIYGPKVRHSNDKYRRMVWQCNDRYNKATRCSTPALEENEIKQMFAEACRRFADENEHVISDIHALIDILTDCSEIDRKIRAFHEEAKAHGDQSDTFTADSRKGLREFEQERRQRRARKRQLRSAIKKNHSITTDNNWNAHLWQIMLDKAIVYHDCSIVFVFRSGYICKVKGMTPE